MTGLAGARSGPRGIEAGDVILEVEGKPVIGYGFNSNGRYAQHGLLGERFIPRLRDAKADSLLDGEGRHAEPSGGLQHVAALHSPSVSGSHDFVIGPEWGRTIFTYSFSNSTL